ncbi:hypothetical protein PybrP1_001169, partial [[Pythium] brassicae (nom. inval.)]
RALALSSAAGAALLALLFHAANDFAPLDAYLPPAAVDASVEGHFADSYYDARALFRSRARVVPGAALHSLPLPGFELEDLTIDVALVRGSSARAVVHISGTHGVEGFAGSGIQSALLQQLADDAASGAGGTAGAADAPTLVFVHALNPYGFAKLRRFNENNVDLNRNFLTPAEFEQRIAMDPNAFGYVDMLEVLNPPGPVTWTSLASTLYGAVRGELTHGKGSLKRAAVCGNYHFPRTIFFGGVEQQASGALLQRFLTEHLDVSKLEHIGLIDVHTGLGAPGVDTLLLKQGADSDVARAVFHDATVAVSGEEDDAAAKGYDGAAGFLCNGIAWFMPPHVAKLCLTQEFGTAPGVAVLKALVEENAMYHYAPTRRLPYGQKLRDVFYLHRSAKWKADVIERGVRVFEQLKQRLSSK